MIVLEFFRLERLVVRVKGMVSLFVNLRVKFVKKCVVVGRMKVDFMFGGGLGVVGGGRRGVVLRLCGMVVVFCCDRGGEL